jgi:hypothetical protein
MILVSLQKEFKDRHRDLKGAGLLMQSKEKANEKCTLSQEVGRLTGECLPGCPKTSSFFIELCRHVISPRKLDYMSLSFED